MTEHGKHREYRTVNKKLTKLYWWSRKRSPKRLIVLLKPKSGGSRSKKNSGALRRTGAPTFARTGAPYPTFKFVPAPLAAYENILAAETINFVFTNWNLPNMSNCVPFAIRYQHKNSFVCAIDEQHLSFSRFLLSTISHCGLIILSMQATLQLRASSLAVSDTRHWPGIYCLLGSLKAIACILHI